MLFQGFIFDVVLTFVVRQLVKYGDGVEWSMIRADIKDRVRKIVPGDAFDETAVAFIDIVIDGVEYLTENLEIGGVLEALKSGDVKLAFSVLKKLVNRYLGVL